MTHCHTGVIALLLLVLATEESLGLVKPEWRKWPRLHGVALLLGALIVGEVPSLGALRQDRVPAVIAGYVLLVIAFGFALAAWGIGWSTWLRYPESVPKDGSLQKKLFYAIGILTVLALAVVTWWTF